LARDSLAPDDELSVNSVIGIGNDTLDLMQDGLSFENMPFWADGWSLAKFRGQLWVGGSFDRAGDVYSLGVARWGEEIISSLPSGPARHTGVTIYPNPVRAGGLLHVNRAMPAEFKLLDPLGRSIWLSEFQPGQAIVLPMDLHPGWYICAIMDEGGRQEVAKLLVID
jgi:hypothetical protein